MKNKEICQYHHTELPKSLLFLKIRSCFHLYNHSRYTGSKIINLNYIGVFLIPRHRPIKVAPPIFPPAVQYNRNNWHEMTTAQLQIWKASEIFTSTTRINRQNFIQKENKNKNNY